MERERWHTGHMPRDYPSALEPEQIREVLQDLSDEYDRKISGGKNNILWERQIKAFQDSGRFELSTRVQKNASIKKVVTSWWRPHVVKIAVSVITALIIAILLFLGHQYLAPLFTPSSRNGRVELNSTYKVVSQTKTDDEIYITVFGIAIHTPPFWVPKDPNNPDAGYRLVWGGDPQVQCDDQIRKSTSTESAGAYSSSTTQVEMICRTNKPVIDNGHLISVVEN